MASTIWKGHLTFGLISIPIKLFRAARAEKIHMHNIQRGTGARVKQVFVPAASDVRQRETLPEPVSEKPKAAISMQRAISAPALVVHNEAGDREIAPPSLSRAELVRGFEYEQNKYVEFEPEELQKIAPTNSDEMQIVEFVRFEEVDPLYLETSFYVAADRGGDKPYALLFEALKTTGFAALAELVMHRRDQIMVLRASRTGIVAHSLFHEDEIRRENESHVDQTPVAPKELDLAVKLVTALSATFEPGKFKDKYRERLHAAIAEKMDKGVVTQSRGVEKTAPVIDIMAALKKSLTEIKKPVKSEEKPTAQTVPQKRKKAGTR